MKYNVNALEIKREEFDKLFAEAEDYNYETGLGKREIGTSKFLFVEDENTGVKVCFAIRNANYKTANARFVLRAAIDEESKTATIGFSKKNDEFELNLGDTAQDAFLTDIACKTTGNAALLELYKSIRPELHRGPAAPATEEAADLEAGIVEAPVAATFMPKVMKVDQISAKSKSQFFKEDEKLYLIVCPDKKGELSVWFANDKVVSIDSETGAPKFERTESGRPWERVLQENEVIVSDDVKKLSRAKSREFFRKGLVATIWKEAGSKGKEKIVLTATRKEIKEFLTEARKTYGDSVEKENGTVKNIKKVFKKARHALTGFVAGAAITAIVLTAGGITGNVDKADAAKDYGKNQVKISAQTNEEETSVVAANVEIENEGQLFNYAKDENGNKIVSDCLGLSQVAAISYEKYKSGLGYLKYRFKQNDVYGKATLQGIGEALAEAAVAELAKEGIVVAEEVNGETITNVVYPVGNKTMEEASEKANMVSFLVLNGMPEADAQVVADAYENTFRAKASVVEIKTITDNDPTEEIVADFSAPEINDAIEKAIESTMKANGDNAAWKVEYVSTQDQIAVVSTDEFLYTIDLSMKDEENKIVPIEDQDDLLARFEEARLDAGRVSFAFDANELYGDEALVKLVTDAFVDEHREYMNARAYLGAFDVQTTEDGKTRFSQKTTMIVEQADGKNAVITFVANEVGSESVSAPMLERSAASFFAAVGFRNPEYTLYKTQDLEFDVKNHNEYVEPETAAAEVEVAPAETPIEAGEYTLGN